MIKLPVAQQITVMQSQKGLITEKIVPVMMRIATLTNMMQVQYLFISTMIIMLIKKNWNMAQTMVTAE